MKIYEPVGENKFTCEWFFRTKTRHSFDIEAKAKTWSIGSHLETRKINYITKLPVLQRAAALHFLKRIFGARSRKIP